MQQRQYDTSSKVTIDLTNTANNTYSYGSQVGGGEKYTEEEFDEDFSDGEEPDNIRQYTYTDYANGNTDNNSVNNNGNGGSVFNENLYTHQYRKKQVYAP